MEIIASRAPVLLSAEINNKKKKKKKGGTAIANRRKWMREKQVAVLPR